MKTNRLIITAILIISGGFLVNLTAQEALKAVVQKCESMDNVTVSVIRRKITKEKRETEKRETMENKVKTVVINVSFKNNEELKKEILAAFEKDKNQADQEMMSKENGKVRSLNYRFGETSYIYLEGTDGNVSLSVRGGISIPVF
ncbi:MAG: DUF5024 domain-containing protein [Tannerella sp.]|jgi:vacuolar-type H+-ATPase subunit F/Vma7|nr:DUF5024 domain-containing protein [Tannerella sp.]